MSVANTDTTHRKFARFSSISTATWQLTMTSIPAIVALIFKPSAMKLLGSCIILSFGLYIIYEAVKSLFGL